MNSPQKSSQVRMTKEAYKKFLYFVIEHAHPDMPHRNWREVIGFLFGSFSNSHDKPEVLITDVLPMDSGSAVYVKVGDYSSIYPILTEKLEKNEFIVGWIHSHPGLSIFLSGTDINTQNLYQSIDSRSIAIVVDHTKIQKKFPGLEAFRVENMNYFPLSITIDNIDDFTSEYQNIIDEIVVGVPYSPFSATSVVHLNQIKLILEGPKVWNQRNKSFYITLSYESEQDGFVQIDYIPKMQGGKLCSFRRSNIRHLAYESGTLAIFQGIVNRDDDIVNFELDKLSVTNKKGVKKEIAKLNIVTQIK